MLHKHSYKKSLIAQKQKKITDNAKNKKKITQLYKNDYTLYPQPSEPLS